MLDWLIIRGGVRVTSLSHYRISHFTHDFDNAAWPHLIFRFGPTSYVF